MGKVSFLGREKISQCPLAGKEAVVVQYIHKGSCMQPSFLKKTWGARNVPTADVTLKK